MALQTFPTFTFLGFILEHVNVLVFALGHMLLVMVIYVPT